MSSNELQDYSVNDLQFLGVVAFLVEAEVGHYPEFKLSDVILVEEAASLELW
jgi:hypothetical protein